MTGSPSSSAATPLVDEELALPTPVRTALPATLTAHDTTTGPFARFGPPLLYLAVTLLFLFPLPLRLSSAVIRVKSNDVWEHLWWVWWVREALTSGQTPYVTDRLFHPTGAPLYLMGMDMVTAVLSIPFQGSLGLVLTYNLLTIAATTFGAYAMYLLALEVVGSRPGALVAGAVFGYMPLLSSVTNMGQMEYTNIGFVPLTILFLWRLRRDGRARTVALGGVALALAIYSSWYQGLFLLLFTLLFVAYETISLGWRRRWRPLRAFLLRVAAWGALAAVLVAPGLLPAVRLAATSDFAETPRAAIALSSLNVLDPFKPNALNPLLGGGTERLSYAMGYVATALALLGLRRAGRRTRFWVLTIAVFLALALGPFLLVGDRRWDLPFLPYNLLYALPLGNIARAPVRFLFLVSIAQAILAAWGVVWLRERFGHERTRSTPRGIGPLLGRANLVVALALALALLEWLPAPRTLASTAVHPFFPSITGEPPGAVYHLPYDTVTPAMYWSTAHRRPIVGGYISRHVPYPLLDSVPVIEQLYVRTDAALKELTEPDIVDQPAFVERGVEMLAAYGIRYVVLHRGVVTPPETARLDAALTRLLPPSAIVWDDGELRAYRIPDRQSSGVVAGFGSGWHAMERRDDNGQRFRWTKGDAAMSLTLLDAAPRTARLTATAFSYQRPTTVDVLLDDRTVATLTVGLAPQTIALDLPLDSGYNGLRFRPREAPLRPADLTGARDNRLLSFALADIKIALP